MLFDGLTKYKGSVDRRRNKLPFLVERELKRLSISSSPSFVDSDDLFFSYSSFGSAKWTVEKQFFHDLHEFNAVVPCSRGDYDLCSSVLKLFGKFVSEDTFDSWVSSSANVPIDDSLSFVPDNNIFDDFSLMYREPLGRKVLLAAASLPLAVVSFYAIADVPTYRSFFDVLGFAALFYLAYNYGPSALLDNSFDKVPGDVKSINLLYSLLHDDGLNPSLKDQVTDLYRLKCGDLLMNASLNIYQGLHVKKDFPNVKSAYEFKDCLENACRGSDNIVSLEDYRKRK